MDVYEGKVDEVKNIKLFEEELPQAMIYPNKVSKFYPYNKILLNISSPMYLCLGYPLGTPTSCI